MKIPVSHPRYESLMQRHKLVMGLREGYVTEAGLIAHGRGETFDYLIGERTIKQARVAEKVAVAMLLISKKPVISVNGNIAALVPREIVRLAELLGAGLEVNLFYRTPKREKLIGGILKKNGAKYVLGTGRKKKLYGLDSKRSGVDHDGIWTSDTVLVPLEDGDRAGVLVELKKNVISIDLNPLSRTSQSAIVSIVDNVIRAVPNMMEFAKSMGCFREEKLRSIVKTFDNRRNLEGIIDLMRKGKIR